MRRVRSTYVRSGSRRSALGRRRARRSHRAVADVVATILLLSLTVVLFAALFAFVTRFPSPPAQSTDQFQASLVTAANNSITGLTIVHLAGPSVPESAVVYLQSSVVGLPNRQFSTSGTPLAWGLGNTTFPWNLGQVWSTTFTPVVPSNANITVFIVSNNQLIFSVILGGSSNSNFAPTILASGTIPSPVGVGKSFQVYVSLGGDYAEYNASNPLKVNFGAVPGLPSANETMNTTAGTGYWVTTVASGKTTTNGTFYAFVTGTSGVGPISGEVTITISGSGGGGGGGSGSFTVLAGVTPSPPVPVITPPPNIYLTATINYTGSSSNVPVGVNFTLSQLEGGRGKAVYTNASLPGQVGDTISGPATLVVYSQSPYPGWLLNSVATITATVKLGGVGTVTGKTVLDTPNFAPGVVYVTTSSTGALGNRETGLSHSCSTSGGPNPCPYLYVTGWDNWTTSLGGPATLSVNGTVWSNVTSCPNPGVCASSTYTIGSTSVSQGSSVAINVAGSTNEWKPSGSNLRSGDVFQLTVLLTVKDGGTVVGYADSTVTITLT
jgi:hypothetical protein